MTNNQRSERQLLIEAAEHLRFAIELLDRTSADGHIAAHADLALNQVEELIPAWAMQRSGPDFSLGLGNG